MKRCSKCDFKNADENKYCFNCGELIDEKNVADDTYTSNKKNDSLRCPNCNSSNIFFITRETDSGYDTSNACCGAILFGPWGLLCGLTGKKESETIRKCGNCGEEF